MLGTAGTFAEDSSEQDVISSLEVLFHENPDLVEKFEQGFKAQPNTSCWKGKDYKSLYFFFKEWLYFNPLLSTTKEYTDKFSKFYVLPNHRGSIQPALEAVRDERFVVWLESFVKARGKYLSSSSSIGLIPNWAKEETISIGQYIIPDKGYSSFNDFFSRKIKDGARPIYKIDDPSVVISPADCDVSRNSEWTKLEVKGDKYSINELLGDSGVADKYKGGVALVCFLNADNYHRFHSPISGQVTFRKDMDGLYFGTKGFFDYFHERRRSAIEIKSRSGKHVAISAVGIGTISSVSLAAKVGDDLIKGDEIGKFMFGGSSLVIFFEPDNFHSAIFDAATKLYKFRSTRMQMGQLLGHVHND
jgi:phosphatidylserine decarboxylase